MRHALIIDDNMIVSRAIEDRLISLGFRSFDHTWTEQQALEAAARKKPDLVVIGDSVACGSRLDVIENISTKCDAPVLVITADRCRLKQRLPAGATLSGPFHLTDIDAAVALARSDSLAA